MTESNETNQPKAPLIHVTCEAIEIQEVANLHPQDCPHTLILCEEGMKGQKRRYHLDIPDAMKPEFHIAFHYGIKHGKVLPRGIENFALQFGWHLRRVLISKSNDGEIRGEVLTLSDVTGETDTLEISAEEGILFAMTHGLPIFLRDDLLTKDGEDMHTKDPEEEGSVSGKEFLRRAIRSGQLPDEFAPEETLVAIANLRRHEVIELIELAEDLEYYEWAFHLSAFIDLDEISPGGMDV